MMGEPRSEAKLKPAYNYIIVLYIIIFALIILLLMIREEFASMVMERVASEYNKLQYNVSQANDHPLIEELTPRIARITATLQNHLQDTFRSSLEQKNREILIQSLQTYASINRQSAAEEMFQNARVLPYMEEVSNVLVRPYNILWKRSIIIIIIICWN